MSTITTAAGAAASSAAASTAKPKLKTSAMIASFADPGQKTTSAPPFGHALVKAAEADSRIVGLTADLGKYTDMHIFAKRSRSGSSRWAWPSSSSSAPLQAWQRLA